MDIEIDSQEKNNLTMDEIQALKGLLQSYPIHNHDGRNSLEVATSRVKKAMDAYKIILPTAATMGEDADDGNAVRIGIDNVDDFLRLAASQTTKNAFAEMWEFSLDKEFNTQHFNQVQAAQSFKIISSKVIERVRRITLYFDANIGNYGSGTVDICSDNNGVPGTVLASSSSKPLDGESFFSFNNITLEPNTLYWFKFRITAGEGGSARDFKIYYNSSSDSYTYGQSKLSTDYGETWSNLGYDLYFKIHLCDTSGRIYKATAGSDAGVSRYIGILDGAYTSGQTPRIITKGVKSNYSDLAPSSVYYLTNTPGIISTAPGNITKEVAVAIDKNNLLIL